MITAHDLADVEHDRWKRCIEDHLGLVPTLLAMLLDLAVPKIGVSRGGSRFDRPQITGGGYDEQDPTMSIDDRAAGDALYLWELLADYATAVSEWLDATTTIPTRCPDDRQVAHDAALLIVGTLLQHTDAIYEHRELADFEDHVFHEIRSMRARHGIFNSPRRRPPELCMLCGEVEVRTHWVTSRTGPRSVEVMRCARCGDETRGEEPPMEACEITEVDGQPVRVIGGLGDDDRGAFAEVVRAARRRLAETPPAPCRSPRCGTVAAHDHGPACGARCLCGMGEADEEVS